MPTQTPSSPQAEAPATIKILVVDDDRDVHFVTRLALRDFDFEGRRLEILNAYTSTETKTLFTENPDIAVVLLDVVMEAKDSGLRLVEWIRQVAGNTNVRIILRTGHPGDAPENDVIRRYDINDYKVKTELTQQRLQITLYTALRSWRNLSDLHRKEEHLQAVLRVGAQLFSAQSLDDFLGSVETQIQTLTEGSETACSGSLIVSRQDGAGYIVAASGRFESLRSQSFDTLPELKELRNEISQNNSGVVRVLSSGVAIFSPQDDEDHRSFVFVELNPQTLDTERLNLVMSHFSLAFANFQLVQYVKGLQDDVLFTISDVIERHFNETASHVRRVSALMGRFAAILGWTRQRAELLRVASILHDVGKIGVPEAILKKPGGLSPEERELMEAHTIIGDQMLSRSNIPLFKLAASIARSHHENWNGSGYPDRIRSEKIPVEGRMMALVDVFDALRSARVYKPAWPLEKVRQEFENQRGRKFDPGLLQVFLSHLDEFNALVEFEADAEPNTL